MNEERLNRVEDKLDRIDSKLEEHLLALARVDFHMGVYNDQLREHMRRSDALEKQVSELYKWKYYIAGALAVVAIVAAFVIETIRQLVLGS
jgi:hypothetical protein